MMVDAILKSKEKMLATNFDTKPLTEKGGTPVKSVMFLSVAYSNIMRSISKSTAEVHSSLANQHTSAAHSGGGTGLKRLRLTENGILGLVVEQPSHGDLS